MQIVRASLPGAVITPLRYVKKCRNLGQTLEFLKESCYNYNQQGPKSSQIIAFLDSKFLNKFLNTPKGCSELYIINNMLPHTPIPILRYGEDSTEQCGSV